MHLDLNGQIDDQIRISNIENTEMSQVETI